jgi:hypothetical protein
MTTHRIDLEAPEKRHGKTRMSYLGEPIGASDSPIYSAARWLLANDHAGRYSRHLSRRDAVHVREGGRAGKVDGTGRGSAWFTDDPLYAVCLCPGGVKFRQVAVPGTTLPEPELASPEP